CVDIVDYGCRIESENMSEPLFVDAISVTATSISCALPATLREHPQELDIWPIARTSIAMELASDKLTLHVVETEADDTCEAQPAPEPACDTCAICDADYGCFDLE